jgi:sterol desaturase/sphingolipid hydroxylase (fatty acid hydroxylase superfamily)
MMTDWQDVLYSYLKTYGAITGRYILFAGVLYVIFYVWKRRDWFRFKIQQKFPKDKDIWREVGYSLLSMAIFAVVGVGIHLLTKAGYTQVYKDFGAHSVGYFIFSVVVFIVLHDAYFYWTHRFMHIKALYPYVHLIHHKSHNPTPWAAFAFHPLEALVEVGIVPIMVLIMPIHPFAILAWVLYMTTMNVLGHLGFELFPDGFASGKITKWHNTSTHHNMHHKFTTSNYGLYFNFWDRVMGTNHARYESEYDVVRERTKQRETLPQQEEGNVHVPTAQQA